MRLEVSVDQASTSRVLARLDRMPVESTVRVRRAVRHGAIRLHKAALKMLSKKGRGRTYQRRGVTHTASAPGDPPAMDTGMGRMSVAWRTSSNGLVAVVGTNVGYMAYHETAPITKRRPWLQPAFDKVVGKIRESISKAVSAALKRSGR